MKAIILSTADGVETIVAIPRRMKAEDRYLNCLHIIDPVDDVSDIFSYEEVIIYELRRLAGTRKPYRLRKLRQSPGAALRPRARAQAQEAEPDTLALFSKYLRKARQANQLDAQIKSARKASRSLRADRGHTYAHGPKAKRRGKTCRAR